MCTAGDKSKKAEIEAMLRAPAPAVTGSASSTKEATADGHKVTTVAEGPVATAAAPVEPVAPAAPRVPDTVTSSLLFGPRSTTTQFSGLSGLEICMK